MSQSRLEKLFKPESVAVVGASRSPWKAGYQILRRIIESDYRGRIYPVNPHASEILGLRTYKSLLDIEDEIDVAIVAIPAPLVEEVIEDCGAKKVKFAVVVSAGFRESGPEGVDRERRLVEKARSKGVRILGPNCFGFIDSYTPINATFSATSPNPGGVAFVSQSGAVISSIIDWSRDVGFGFSKIVSLGNKADLDESDFLEYLAEDPETKVITLYLESISNGRRFVDTARRIATFKPVILLKGGVTEAGARAAQSHTGAIASGLLPLKAASLKAGVVLVKGLRELFHLSWLLSTQGVPESGGVAILTNAGGPAVVASDLLSEVGLELARLSTETVAHLRSKLPPQASISNPVDVLGDAGPDRFEYALQVLTRDSSVAVVLVLVTPQAATRPLEVAESIARVARGSGKVVVVVMIGGSSIAQARRLLAEHGIPVFEFVEDAVEAVSGAVKYSKLKRKLLEYKHLEPQIRCEDLKRALEIVEEARMDGRRTLLDHEALSLIEACGIKVPPFRQALSEAEAVKAAEELGYPVAVKVESPDILHKSDIGGVALNISTPTEVREAYRRVVENARRLAPHASLRGVIVQRMAERGVELLVGAYRDPVFGPLVVAGMGGVYTELFRDISSRLAPLSKQEAEEMLSETRIYQVLRGYRRLKPSDISCVIDSILRISGVVTNIQQISELDINPLIVYEKGSGCVAVDVKVVLS